jgi:ubiquinone biosynthesis protein UbiJ
MVMSRQPAVSALNHLLAQNGWAKQRLSRFKGRIARFDLFPFSFACSIQEDGTLRTAAPDSAADAICTISPSLLPRLALDDRFPFEQIKCSGDPELTDEILFLAHNLRWDAAEDLSRYSGDIAAERIMQFAHSSKQQLRGTANNLAQAFAEYWTEERPLISRPQQIASFAQEVSVLRDSLESLDKRIQGLLKVR